MLLTALLPLLLPDPVAATWPAVAYVRADPDGLGSGVVIDRDKRLLVTCRHVVGDRKSAEVFFPHPAFTLREDYLSRRDELRTDGRLVRGKVLRTSDELDLALLELDSLPAGTTAVRLADTPPAPGERVLSIGHRADLDTLWNASRGVVRQSGRLADGYDWQGKALAKDAPAVLLQLPVEEGDSGGPVLNSRGELVAVVSGLRRKAVLATIGIRADGVRAFVVGAPVVGAHPSGHPQRVPLRSTVWVRPTATDVRTAGVVIDAKRRLVLTSNVGVGPLDRVGVACPLVQKGQVNGERDAYRDPLADHLAGGWHVGTVRHRDPARDLALVQLDTLPEGVQAVPLATTDPDVGDEVTASSHPAGTEFAFAHSTGSVKQRGNLTFTRGGRKVPAVVLQLPAQAASPGGPVVNAAGELVGVLAAKDAPALVGYTVRLAEVRAFLADADAAPLRDRLRTVWNELNTPAKFAGWAALAREDADAALALHPDCVPALLAKGTPAQLDRVLELEPQHRDALVRRAANWTTKAEPKNAQADLLRVLDVTPADADARRRRRVQSRRRIRQRAAAESQAAGGGEGRPVRPRRRPGAQRRGPRRRLAGAGVQRGERGGEGRGDGGRAQACGESGGRQSEAGRVAAVSRAAVKPAHAEGGR